MPVRRSRARLFPQHSGGPAAVRGLGAGALTALAAILFVGGCGGTSTMYRPEYLDRGYTIFLPGIMGRDYLNPGVPKGLVDADAPTAVELYDWTEGPLLMPYTLRAEERNRREAAKLAQKIIAYQDQYPGRPVHLIGHSGGGGLAVMILEALPEDRRITSAFLLGPPLGHDYDLRPALRRTELGIHNYYSWLDVPVLAVLTTMIGTMEGRHMPTAGAIGFTMPEQLAEYERPYYEQAITQHPYTFALLSDGHLGGHFGWAGSSFIEHQVAPHVARSSAASMRMASHARVRE